MSSPAGGDQPIPDMLSRLGIGMITTDPDGQVTDLNAFAERLTGWRRDEAQGRPVDRVFRLVREGGWLPDQTLGLPRPDDPGETGRPEEAVLETRDEQHVTIEHTLAAERDEFGRIRRIVILFHDVSQRNYAVLQLARQATRDSLTGLLNRHAFIARVEEALRATRDLERPCAVCHLDLDQFNLVNATCGHGAGDDLLGWVAAMLREEVRETDVVARIGGDVFGILFGERSLKDVRGSTEGLLRRLREFQFSWGDRTFPIGACIGLVPVLRGVHTVAEVLSAADHACAQAKKHGRNQINIVPLEDEALARRQLELEWVTRIRRNLKEGLVTLFAQPIRPLASRTADGLYFEVLLRRVGEDGRMTSAAGVIQAAEQYGLMGSIDRWVIQSALQHLASLPREVMARLRLCCINISGVSLHDKAILEFIHQQLADSQVAPQKICFELTETAAVRNLPQARWLIDALQAIGCRFALDDFGSGLASYTYLKDLPVNYLKIAGDFVDGVVANALDRAMVESINQIGRVLGIETIAEAVPSQAALDLLRTIGVDYAQGNWVGVPRPLAELCRTW
jgi:diguanylate cyclase (GGDEF)-like protein/PAS domain S-box-containing protein